MCLASRGIVSTTRRARRVTTNEPRGCPTRAQPTGPADAGGVSTSTPLRREPCTLSGWALVPLRAFLGVTFCFAGLQKLANPNFFNANSPSSIQAQLIASIRISPLHELLGHLLRFAVPIGIMIALAELAVGLGTILGLWTRVAAAGGMVLSVTLFLTVSFHSSPYYTGADIVFVFAWIPLVLAGSGGVLSLDGVIAARVAGSTTSGRRRSFLSASPLSSRCAATTRTTSVRAQGGRRCNVHGCPFLSADPAGRQQHGVGERSRRGRSPNRRFGRRHGCRCGRGRRRGRWNGGRVGTGSRWRKESREPKRHAAAPPGCVRALRALVPTTHRHDHESAAPTTTAPLGTPIGLASEVPVGGAARFTDPKTGDPGLVLQLAKGRFVAYDAICPMPGARSAIPPLPTSSCVRVTVRNSTRARARW